MELNIVSRRCLLRLHKILTNSTKACNDNLCGRHGTCCLRLRLKRPHCCHTALIVLSFSAIQVLSYLSLAAACSTASVTDLLLEAGEYPCLAKLCGRYQFSAAMAFLSWFLSTASCLFNFWLFPSL